MSNVISRFLGTSVAATLVATLAAALVVIVPPPASAAPVDTVVGDFKFNLDAANVAAGATVTDYLGAGGAVTIPSTVSVGGVTYNVTAIGASALRENGITSVSIPGSVSSIGYASFYKNQISSISIPNSVVTIAAWAFGNNALTSVTIPPSVTAVADSTFYDNAISSVTIPSGVTSIGPAAFYKNDLTTVTIPNGVTSIGDHAFRENALTYVTLPSALTSVGQLAFSGNKITAVTIPPLVTTIKNSAFSGNLLTSVLMKGPAPTTIGSFPFGTATVDTPLVTFYSHYAASGYTTPRWTAGGSSYASKSAVPESIVTVTPARIADIADVTAGVVRCVPVVGLAGVPAGASGVVLNVTTAGASGGGNVVVYPDYSGNSASAPPASSTVNFEKDQDVANAAIVALPANGKVCTFTQGATLSRLILDVTGYTIPGSGVTLQNSQRLMDTRGGSFPAAQAGPVQPNDIRTIQVTGNAGVPAGATAVLVNVTVTEVAAPGHLRMWATGAAKPNTSVLNYAAGKDKANAQIVALSADGKISFESFASGSTQVIIDVVGYVSGATQYVATAPTRIVETRAAFGLIGPIAGPLAPNTIYPVPLGDRALVPNGATAVVLNVTAVQPSGPGHIRVYPDLNGLGTTVPPDASTLNYIAGRDIPNLVIVKLPPSRIIDFYNVLGGSNSTDLVVDVVGYVYGGA